MTLPERVNYFDKITHGVFDEMGVTEVLIDMGYFTAPASTCFHENYEGGLFEHSLKVAKELLHLTDALGLEWDRGDNQMAPMIVGLFHDLCKCDGYMIGKDGVIARNPEQMLPGHGEKSLYLARDQIALTEEEAMCIRYHMGAFTDQSEWKYYTRAVRKYPNVLWTHTADMLATHGKDR